MQGLPAYQTVIRESLDEIGSLIEKYGADNTPLFYDNPTNSKEVFEKAKQHCDELLNSNLPKLMMFGVYNSGKSTLLNALLGENKASVADVPETDKVTSYQWNGYELLDTPGIDAPEGHEKISLESLTQCQVILFVISAARSFENEYIFDAMRKVVHQGKRLLIVINDKDAIGLDQPEMAECIKAIQRNLIKKGFDTKQASNFCPCPVNAQQALDGRLLGEQDLVETSGILSLEQYIVNEINRIDGFSIVSDLCGYLIKIFSPMVSTLTAMTKGRASEYLNDFLEIRKEYAEFCDVLESKIKELCLTMDGCLMTCFPTIEELETSSKMDTDKVNDAIKQEWAKYAALVNTLVREEVERYQQRLTAQIKRIQDNPIQANASISTVIDDSALQGIDNQLTYQKVSLSVPSVSDNSLCDKVDEVSSIVAGASTLLKLPVPAPVLLILTIAPKLFRALFGKSDAELARERIEAEAAARRRAEEERAQNIVLWRQQLSQYCQNTRMQFFNAVKSNIFSKLNNNFITLFDNIESNLLAFESKEKDISSDSVRLQTILTNLERAQKDLLGTIS